MNNIEKLINVAKTEIGYMEKASNNNLYDKNTNAGYKNYTKYWQDILPSYQGQPWCACFVTWCFEKAFGRNGARKLLRHYPYVYCPTMANLFQLNANPKVGDVVIFYYGGQFVHTGIVTYVKGDYFETIEGNTNNGSTIVPNGGSVCKKAYYNSKLIGTKFCTPNYSLLGGQATTQSKPTTTTNSSNNSFSQWVKRLQTECNRQGFSRQVVDGIQGKNTLAGCPQLMYTSSGNITKLLQERLNALGYNCGSADGIFGVNTKNAVIRFQKAKGLVADGIVGQNTWRKLLNM